ncbi:hypothetical protein V1259_00810 [Zafaria sp. J156]|nr:hypothetical protein [Zafaria sp. J156]MEE1619926.1 hypothetical protein [Zafaria sp. J156]
MPPAPTGDAARQIGPGFAGFLATALMVVAVIFLIRDMVRRIRRVRYAADAESRQQELVERGRELQPDDDALPRANDAAADGGPAPDASSARGASDAREGTAGDDTRG